MQKFELKLRSDSQMFEHMWTLSSLRMVWHCTERGWAELVVPLKGMGWSSHESQEAGTMSRSTSGSRGIAAQRSTGSRSWTWSISPRCSCPGARPPGMPSMFHAGGRWPVARAGPLMEHRPPVLGRRTIPLWKRHLTKLSSPGEPQQWWASPRNDTRKCPELLAYPCLVVASLEP